MSQGSQLQGSQARRQGEPEQRSSQQQPPPPPPRAPVLARATLPVLVAALCLAVVIGLARHRLRRAASDVIATEGASFSVREPGTVREVSESFGQPELARLCAELNSPDFQRPLEAFNCGDPFPPFKIRATLRPQTAKSPRRVTLYVSPGNVPSDLKDQCLYYALNHRMDKALARIEPDRNLRPTIFPEPQCDCDHRGEIGWVKFGPSPIQPSPPVAGAPARMPR